MPLQCERDGPPLPLALLQRGPHTALLSQLKVLALGMLDIDPCPALDAVTKLVKAGKLPRLQKLIVHRAVADASFVSDWRASLVAAMQSGRKQGLVLHVLPVWWYGTGSSMVGRGVREAVRRAALPDPDALAWGLQHELWSDHVL